VKNGLFGWVFGTVDSGELSAFVVGYVLLTGKTTLKESSPLLLSIERSVQYAAENAV